MEFFGKSDYSRPVAIVLLDGSERCGLHKSIAIEDQYGRANTLIFTAENIHLLPQKITAINQEAPHNAQFHFYQLTHHTQLPHVPKNKSTYGVSTLTDRKGVQKRVHDKGLIEELDKLPGGTKQMTSYWGGCEVSPVVASHFKLTAMEGIHRDSAFEGNLDAFLQAMREHTDYQAIKAQFESNPRLKIQAALNKSLNLGFGNIMEGRKSHGFKPRIFDAESWQNFLKEKKISIPEHIP